MKKLITLFLFSYLVLTATAQTYDNSFGVAGKVEGAFTTTSSPIDASVQQADGKYVALSIESDGTNLTMTLRRFNNNGTMDNAFGTGGANMDVVASKLFVSGTAVELQSTGKIVASCESEIARYNTNGTLDNTFSTNGFVSFTDFVINDVAVLPNDDLILVGYDRNGPELQAAVMMLDANGAVSTLFGTNGRYVFPAFPNKESRLQGVAIDGNGQIVTVGTWAHNPSSSFADSTDVLAMRLNPSGSLDFSFNTTGFLIWDNLPQDIAYDVAVQSDGKLVLAGASRNNTGVDDLGLVMRLNSNGSMDNSFHTNGFHTMTNPSQNISMVSFFKVDIQSDGGIVAIGHNSLGLASNPFIAKLTTSGDLDVAFGSGGTTNITFTFTSLTTHTGFIDAANKILVIGSTYNINTFDFSYFLHRFSNIPTSPASLENYLIGKVKVYPNPTTTGINIEYENPKSEIINYEVISTTGAVVKRGVLKDDFINLSALANNAYFLKLSVGNHQLTQKIVLQR